MHLNNTVDDELGCPSVMTSELIIKIVKSNDCKPNLKQVQVLITCHFYKSKIYFNS